MEFTQQNLALLAIGLFGILSFIAFPTFLGIVWKVWETNKVVIEKNTHAIIKLETTVEHLNKYVERIPKLQDDINGAHKNIRELRSRLTGDKSE